MNIKKAINSKTLLIPSVLLNAALLVVGFHYNQVFYRLAMTEAGAPSVFVAVHASGMHRSDTGSTSPVEVRDAAVPAPQPEVQ